MAFGTFGFGGHWDLASFVRKWARNIPVCGICLRNTNKHVVIRNSYIYNWKDNYFDRQLSGIKIINASNITIENNVIEKNTEGIYMDNIQQNQDCKSTNITIRSNNLVENGDCAIRAYYTYDSSITYNNITAGGTGVYSYKSRLSVAHNNIFDNGNGIICSDGDHSVIENNFLAGNGNGVYCTGGHQTISNNTIFQNMLGIHSSYASPTIANNTITHNGDGIYHYGFERTPIIVDNIISNNSWEGISCEGKAIIEHNLISSNGWSGIGLSLRTASICDNIISLNEENGIVCGLSAGEKLTPHYNNIFGNGGKGIKNSRDATINATHNYWGSADGPSGYGNGHGDEVDKNVIYEPWLTEPNPDAGPR